MGGVTDTQPEIYKVQQMEGGKDKKMQNNEELGAVRSAEKTGETQRKRQRGQIELDGLPKTL